MAQPMRQPKHQLHWQTFKHFTTMETTQITRVQTAKNNYSQKVDEREIAFKDVKKFTTRIIANLSGTNVSPETITDSKTIAAKIKATKTTKPKMDTQNPDSINPTSTAHSNSRQSFDSLYENFNDLINLLQTTTGYDTNTTEFQIPALTVFADTLKTANENTNTAIIEVTNKRIERDNLLYTPITGLVDAALDTKNYIKGIFGASSPQYKTVNKISFRNR